jgi:membrane-associated phospholipid phosphatase
MAKLKKTADAVQDVDAALTTAVLPYRHSAPVEALSWLSEVGDQPQMRALCGGVIGLGLLRRDRQLVRTGARMLAAHTLATFIKNQVKLRVDRTRPRSREDAGDIHAHKIKPGRDTAKEETSFPSGHSAGAAAVARAFVRDYPGYAAPAYAAGGLIALAQIPRCAHYPTDVGSGLAIGLASEALVERAWRAIGSKLA